MTPIILNSRFLIRVMLAIKLQRIGKKHQPSYRVVVAEKRSKLNAPPVEDMGSYNTSTKLAQLKKERIMHWIGVGAQPTITAWNLLVREGIISSPKQKMHMRIKKGETSAPEVAKA